MAVAVPLEGGGAVVARIDGAALKEPLQGLPCRIARSLLCSISDTAWSIVARLQNPDRNGSEQFRISLGASESEYGTRSCESSIDGVERVYGLGRVGKTGYIVMVGIPSAILYASAWRQLMGYAVVGLIVVFCTMTGALLIARSIAACATA